MNECPECIDCHKHFCLTCDDYTRCPDCKQLLCELCSADALDDRKCRCVECSSDEDLSTVRFPRSKETRKLHKRYTIPQRGRLDE